MKIERINSNPAMIEEYRNRGASYWGGILLPTKYLHQGDVYAAFDDTGAMVGGYAVVMASPFRTIELLPDVTKRDHPLLQLFKVEQPIEVTGVWFNPSSRSKLESLRLWYHLIRTILRSNRSHIIFGFNGSSAGLRKLYDSLSPVVLFDGAGNKGATSDGVATHSSLVVCAAPTSRLIPALSRQFVSRVFSLKDRGVYRLHGNAPRVNRPA